MLGHLSADIICSEKRTVFRERSSRKTVSYKEQIMSKDKCPRIFSPQMKGIVFIMLQIFFATCAILKIGEYSQIFLSFSWGIFGLVMCLDPSCANKNIWWIVIAVVIKYNNIVWILNRITNVCVSVLFQWTKQQIGFGFDNVKNTIVICFSLFSVSLFVFSTEILVMTFKSVTK